MEIINNANILITGGTGSFGNYITKFLLENTNSRITVYSRDEFKQYQMRLKFPQERLKFLIGDVRDLQRTKEAMKGIDLVFHAAALKQVPACEYNPFEAVKTNILGGKNVTEAAIENNVPRVVAISTDKAVKPVNAMGMSKALQERIMLQANNEGGTAFNVVRYGNIVGSRGSVIPLFINSIRDGRPMPITQPEMTRFWLTLEDAMNLVFYAAKSKNKGCLFVKKAPSCTILQTAFAVARYMNETPKTIEVGLRKGEKVHEVLVAENEMLTATDTENYYIINPEEMIGAKTQGKEYTSENTNKLTDAQLDILLAKAMNQGGLHDSVV